MFARYDYKAGSTVANIMADVVKLITGTTDKAQLSADCVQANTSIVATRQAGWEVYDAAAGTNKVVVRAPCVSGGHYKTVLLDGATSAGYLLMRLIESWNTTSKVHTNQAYLADNTTYSPIIDTAAGGTLYIIATARCLFMTSYAGTGWTSYPITLVTERELNTENDVIDNITPAVYIAADMFNYGQSQSNAGIKGVRAKNSAGADAVNQGAIYAPAILATVFQTSVAGCISSVKYRNAEGVPSPFFMPLYASGGNVPSIGGKVLGDIYIMTGGIGAIGDEIIFNGAPYFIAGYGGNRLVIRKD